MAAPLCSLPGGAAPGEPLEGGEGGGTQAACCGCDKCSSEQSSEQSSERRHSNSTCDRPSMSQQENARGRGEERGREGEREGS